MTLLAGAGEIFAAVEAFHLVVELAGEVHVEDSTLGDRQRLAEQEIHDLQLRQVNRLDGFEHAPVIDSHRRLLNLQIHRVQRDLVGLLRDLEFENKFASLDA